MHPAIIHKKFPESALQTIPHTIHVWPSVTILRKIPNGTIHAIDATSSRNKNAVRTSSGQAFLFASLASQKHVNLSVKYTLPWIAATCYRPLSPPFTRICDTYFYMLLATISLLLLQQTHQNRLISLLIRLPQKPGVFLKASITDSICQGAIYSLGISLKSRRASQR